MKGQLASHSALIAGILLTVCLAVTEAFKIPLCSFSYMTGEDAVITFPVPTDPQESFKIEKTLTSGENKSIVYCNGLDNCQRDKGYNISFNETTKLISVIIINVCFAHKGDYTLIFIRNQDTEVCSLDVKPNMFFTVNPVMKSDGRTLDYVNLSCDGNKMITLYPGKIVPEVSCTYKDTCGDTVTQVVSYQQILLQLVMAEIPLPCENEYKLNVIMYCVLAILGIVLLQALSKVRDVPHLFRRFKSSMMRNTPGEPSTPKGPNTPSEPNPSKENVQLLATDPDPGVSNEQHTNVKLRRHNNRRYNNRRFNNITPVAEDAVSDTPVN